MRRVLGVTDKSERVELTDESKRVEDEMNLQSIGELLANFDQHMECKGVFYLSLFIILSSYFLSLIIRNFCICSFFTYRKRKCQNFEFHRLLN